MEHERFRDPTTVAAELVVADEVLIVCPACGGCGRVVVTPGRELPVEARFIDRLFVDRRLVCRSCGLTRSWPRSGESQSIGWGPGCDPFFGIPLWLTVPCCGRSLWCYNSGHLDLLRHWIAADHRERGSEPPRSGDRWETLTLLEDLPAWITSRKNRRHVLEALDRLDERLDGASG